MNKNDYNLLIFVKHASYMSAWAQTQVFECV